MKKIALIVDVDNWAYANIAKNVKMNLNKYFDIDIIPTSYVEDCLPKVLIYTKNYDLVHIFWRGKLYDVDKYSNVELLNNYGKSFKEFKKEYMDNKIITTAVYDHLFLDTEEDLSITKEIITRCDSYYVSSQRLFNIYSNLEISKQPTTVITDGVDINKFFPKNEDRFSNIKNREIVIGWVGNSAWESGKEDFKGVSTLLKPAVKELQKKGYKLKLYLADKQERFIPHNEMNNYYSNIDLYICTSKIEGTPNPVLESMACGIPVITTDVGIVPEVFGPLQKEYILKERTKDCLKENIIKFIDNIENIDGLRNENKVQIKNWTWVKISNQFKEFFDKQFKKVKNEKNNKL